MEPGKEPAKPRGRGALLTAALAKAKEVRAGAEVEMPRPRGRAALLEKMQALALQKPGLSEVQKPQLSLQKLASSAQKSELSEMQKPGLSSVHVEGEKKDVSVKVSSSASSEDSEEKSAVFYRGEVGQKIFVQANYIRLSIEENKGVFEYHVRFEPDVDSKSARINILNKNVQALGGVKMFDGGSCLYLPIKLQQPIVNIMTIHPIDGSKIEMVITFIKTKRIAECLHLFNVLFKRVMNALKLVLMGKKYFDPVKSHLIPQHKLEILPGYVVAVDEYEGGLMMCLDAQHRVLRTLNALELLQDIHRSARDRYKVVANEAIVGAVVITKYNNKTYIIDDILWDYTPQMTFDTHNGSKISFIDYYKNQYGIEVMNSNQPLLLHIQKVKVSGSSTQQERHICLIPELCHLTGLTDAMKADFKVMKDVAAFTRISPGQRMDALRKYIDNVKNSPRAQSILSEWGVKVEDATIDLNARILAPETILFGGGTTYTCDAKADWSSALSRTKVDGPKNISSWVIICLEKDRNVAMDFSKNMCMLGKTCGMNINGARIYECKNDRVITYGQALEDVINDTVECVVLLVQSQRNDLYSVIKKTTCVTRPVACQVILTKNLTNLKKARTVTLKIVLQINCKLGGSLWILRLPVKTWMVCGIDTFHSKDKKMSVGALVASTNETMSNFYTSVMFQPKELSDALKIPFIRSLEKFYESTGNYPKQIVIFRDGVGDGELDHVKQYELEQINSALQHLNITDCKVCFVVVQKRINTRIITPQGNNALPGTVVDHTITRKNQKDFYLVPQNVNQGTVTPTHYIILHDTAPLKPDHVQKLAFKLCHLYYNWSGTIRVPAPCMYAHKVAHLVGNYIGKEPHTMLSDRLYYL